MADIYLIRHGEAAASWEQDRDPGLSEQGVVQANSLASDFTDIPIERIFSSPLQRAQQTAIPLGHSKALDVQLCESMREIPTPVNIPVSERISWLRSIALQPWFEAPAVVTDWRQGILETLAQLPKGSAVFTHFMVMNAVLGHIQGHRNLVCYQPDYCSVLSLNLGSSLEVVSIGNQSSTRVL